MNCILFSLFSSEFTVSNNYAYKYQYLIYFERIMLSPFISSLTQIIVSEIGDKTFFITAILGMNYSMSIVFLGSYTAAISMTLLSCLFGYIIPQLVNPVFTYAIASLVFFYFGLQMLREIRTDGDVSDDEEEEAQEEVKKVKLKLNRQVGKFSIFREVLLLNIFGEWGDRSQFTTVALAIEDTQAVILGALLGHFICSGIAVLGGKVISSRIPENYIKYIGGILFIFCGLQNAYNLL